MTKMEQGQLRTLRLFLDSDAVSESLPPCTSKVGHQDCEDQNAGEFCPSCAAYAAWLKFKKLLEAI